MSKGYRASAFARRFSCNLAASLPGLLLAGCSTPPPAVAPVPPAPTAPGRFYTAINPALALNLGAVALVCSPAKADLQLINLPLTRGEAGAAGAGRVLESLKNGASGDDNGAGTLLLIGVIGVGAAGGWFQGAFFGMNAEDVQRTIATCARTAAEFSLVERLANSILARAGDFPVKSLTRLTGWFPAEIPQPKVRLRVGANGVLERALVPPPSHPLAEQGVDTFAVVQVFHALCGIGRKNLSLQLVLEVKVTLLHTRDWSVAGEFIVSYASVPRTFMDWSRADGQPLREEWESAVRGLENRIAAILAQSPS